jgi:hypothetical protein
MLGWQHVTRCMMMWQAGISFPTTPGVARRGVFLIRRAIILSY